jgi:hypothetical protein
VTNLSDLPLEEALYVLVIGAGIGGLYVYGFSEFAGEARLEASGTEVERGFHELCKAGKVVFMRLNGGVKYLATDNSVYSLTTA